MIFKKKTHTDFFRNYIKKEGQTTGITFVVWLDNLDSFFGTKIEFTKEDPNMVFLYSENQSEWEEKRTATDTYFHINEIVGIQKQYPANNDPNLAFKNLLKK